MRFEHDHLEVLRLLFMSSRTYCGPDRYGYDSHSHSDTTKSEFGDPNELQDLPARSGSTGKMNRLSIKIIRRFSSLNRSLCAALESRFPRVFDTMGEGTTYVPLISTTAKRMIRDGARDVIEVGGIDRPLLHRDGTFRYVGLDIEYRERCREVYDHFLVQSIESPIEGRFDLIFSQHLLEHVRDNRAAARSMFAATKPAGFVCHYVPNRGHPYALLLRMLSNRLQRRLLELTSPTGKTKGGYPTYFDRCNPSEMRQTFIEAGFTNVSTVVFYSPTPYFRVFLPAHVLIVAFMHVCRWMGLDAFCSGFVITAERPGATTTEPDPESIDSRNVHHQPDAC